LERKYKIGGTKTHFLRVLDIYQSEQ